MTNYELFYKETLPVREQWPPENSWDCFISAYNSSDRVRTVYERVKATVKHWIIQPDYQFESQELPDGNVYAPATHQESDLVREYFDSSGLQDLAQKRICIDITGFIKPYMMFMMRWLAQMRVPQVDVLYSEPDRYEKKEGTKFSDEAVTQVRQVAGFAGLHTPDVSKDLLIIGSGYDHALISQVAENKNNARKSQIFGFPSLRPDMYQENILRAHLAAEEVGFSPGNSPRKYFAPANDPFVTAQVLQRITGEERRDGLSNLYLCPLATKPQALGFTLFYLYECINQPVSILYPFCETHSRETSKGLSRIWKYTVHLPPLDS